jgi:sterol desaturase/sphingolipid hydroxylase (fatty acid hydroxylase superfamily)
MSHVDIARSKEPIRLFKSDFLEFFTHIHPTVVLIIWTPIMAIFLVIAIAGKPEGISLFYVPAGFLAGLFTWTLSEYTLHRFVFHFRLRTPWQERLSFLFHSVHHAQLFYGFFYLALSVLLGIAHWIAPLFPGFVGGYLLYDMLHYSTHHFRFRWRAWQFLRRHHMAHHAQTPTMRFGVSSPLWDIVFGTMPS